MSSDKKGIDLQPYEATPGQRDAWAQDKKASMEECRAVYMAEGSKGAAIWSGITAAGAWWSWQKQMWPRYIRPQHLIFLVGAAGTCAFYIQAENKAHECTQRQRDLAVMARGQKQTVYSIFGEDSSKKPSH